MVRRSIVAGILILSIASYSTSHAATAQFMTLTPAAREISVDPGGTAKSRVTVVNRQDTPLTVSLSVAPYGVKGLEYTPDFQPIAGTVDASQWVTLGVTGGQTIKGQGTRDVDVTVRAPDSTAPGGYYAVIFATTESAQPSGGGVVTQARLGSILYITVNGEVSERSGATAENVDWFHLSGAIPLAVRATNAGGVHYNATVTTSVRNLLGQEVYRDSQQRYILPQTERRIVSDWVSDTVIGLYRIERNVELPSGRVNVPDVWCLVVHPLFAAGLIVAISGMIGYIIVRRRRHV